MTSPREPAHRELSTVNNSSANSGNKRASFLSQALDNAVQRGLQRQSTPPPAQAIPPAQRSHRASRSSFSDTFFRSHSSPAVPSSNAGDVASSAAAGSALSTSPLPSPPPNINPFGNLSTSLAQFGGQLGQNLVTAIRPSSSLSVNPPSTNSLDRFPSPPLRSRSSFGTNQQHYIASSLLNHNGTGHHEQVQAASASGGGGAPMGRTASSASSTPPQTPSGLVTRQPSSVSNGSKQRETPSVIVTSSRTPYLPGFQPQGVYNSRTTDFAEIRQSKSEGRRLEIARLQRRLDKLVDLHFSHPSALSGHGHGGSEGSTQSQLSDLAESQPTWRNSRSISATDMWSIVKRSVKSDLARKQEDLRIAEQLIVKWEDDHAVTRCPICLTQFSLTIRKHHCRLCGRVICAIPPNSSPAPIGRKSCCSTFWSYEWFSPTSREKGGLVIESEAQTPMEETPVDQRQLGVRSCRECINTILRQQAIHHKPKMPMWYKLHEALLHLQKEIDEALPALQEQVVTIGSTDATLASLTPSQRSNLLTSRKNLVSLLASFDSMAKRVRDLPLGQDHQANGAQQRLQNSIANRAALFLQERMGLLKGLGSFDELPPSSSSSADSNSTRSKRGIAKISTLEQQKAMEEKSVALAVLLEQEQLVQSYLDDANSRRQLVDSASLKQNLDDIQAEIRRVKGSD